jgi:hypothetical protein
MLCGKAHDVALQEACCHLSLPFVVDCGVLAAVAMSLAIARVMVLQAVALPDHCPSSDQRGCGMAFDGRCILLCLPLHRHQGHVSSGMVV